MVGTAGADNYLGGSWKLTSGNWAYDEDTKFSFTGNIGTLTLSLDAQTTYNFNLKDGDKYYSNNEGGNMTSTNCNNWTLYENGGNSHITTTDAGNYVFKVMWIDSNPHLWVTYPNGSVVYLCNNLSWTQPYAYILGTEYWNGEYGSGSNSRPNSIIMVQIDSSDIWKAEFSSPIGDGVMAFLKNIQDNYSNFYNTEAVYRTGYSSETPLFVPSKISSGTFNGTTYYSDGTTPTGEWHAYPTYTRSVTEGNFGTICLPFAATVEGATVFKIVSTVGSGDSMTGINLESVDNLEAGKAYIFKATGTELTATYSGSYTDASAGYGMMGNLSSTPATVADGNYIVYGNQLRKVAGATVTVGQYRGYITLAGIGEASARSANFIAFEDDQATTIDNLTISQFDKTAPMYNLAGQRVGENYKGIVVKNGKKYINK
jgi:hypothetical protein